MTHIRLFAAAFLAASSLALSPSALAQDEDEFDIDDLLEEDSGESTVGDEVREMESEAELDSADPLQEVALPPRKKKLIKTLQKKNFLKLGRFEAVPYVGLVTNDPFIRRILFGANFGYHITEIFQIELQGSYSPNFGSGDWKPITGQITGDDANQVAPEISRQTAHFLVNFNYSPFYGKIATRRSSIFFDIYGTFGTGFVYTVDDLELIGNEGDPAAEATRAQIHPAFSVGAGLRLAFNKTFALRFEGRSISYIGVLEATKLELRNNLTFIVGASIFFGRRIE